MGQGQPHNTVLTLGRALDASMSLPPLPFAVLPADLQHHCTQQQLQHAGGYAAGLQHAAGALLVRRAAAVHSHAYKHIAWWGLSYWTNQPIVLNLLLLLPPPAPLLLLSQMLAVVSAIFLPITFLAGVYGTNFDQFFPEVSREAGTVVSLGQ
jgi:hypothetical protein